MKTNKQYEDSARSLTYAFVGIVVMILLALLTGCGSKKTISQSGKKEKTDIELTDNSTINTKIEQEQQLIDTKIRERIVTFYGVRFDTIEVEGKPVITPTPYPLKMEEDREIVSQMIIDLFRQMDSTQMAVNWKYKNDLNEKDKKISELKETRIYYHIALIVLGLGLILVLVLRR